MTIPNDEQERMDLFLDRYNRLCLELGFRLAAEVSLAKTLKPVALDDRFLLEIKPNTQLVPVPIPDWQQVSVPIEEDG